MITNVFRSAFVRRRMAASHLGIILQDFVLDLHARGHALLCIQSYGQIAEHFSRWLATQPLAVRQIDESVVERFIGSHLPRCRCPRPAPTHPRCCRAALGRLLVFLRQTKQIGEPIPAPASSIERLVKEYDRHLDEVAGLASATRQYRCRYAREFLLTRRVRGRTRFSNLSPQILTAYVERQAQSLTPASLRVLTIALRSFLRFLHFTGRVRQHMVQAVPTPAPWPRSSLPQILSEEQVRSLVNSFDRTTPTGRRDFAMVLCLCLLGLRTQEVATLTMNDVDWQRLTVRLRCTKQRRERLLPLPPRLGRALMDYLRRGRPKTNSRALFLRHRAPLGEALQVHHVRSAMRRAFARCGLGTSRIHLLRHTFATRLHRKGVGLKAIADLLGHGCLDTTAGYARVSLDELRQAALPWPERRR
jgi:integrase/recombinase XerD